MPQIITISPGVTVYITTLRSGVGRRQAERAAAAQLIEAALGHPCDILHRPDGSPVAACGGVEISLSHSRHYAALAVSHIGRIGIDIEESRPAQLRRVAPRVLSPAEMAVYDTDEDLLRAWTLKEAAYKAVQDAPADLRHIALPLDGGPHILVNTNGGAVPARILYSEATPHACLSVVTQ